MFRRQVISKIFVKVFISMTASLIVVGGYLSLNDESSKAIVNTPQTVVYFEDSIPENVQKILIEEDKKDGIEIIKAFPTIPVIRKSLEPSVLLFKNQKPEKEKVSEESIFQKYAGNFDITRQKQLRCLALNIFFESGSENRLSKLAVGYVPDTRSQLNFWDDTYCEVVKSGYKGKKWGCQFSWYCDGKQDKVYLYSKRKNGTHFLNEDLYNAWVDSVKIAIVIYTNEIENPTNGATNYYNPSICFKNSVKLEDGTCHPPWAIKGIRTGRMILANTDFTKNGMIGNHLFLVDKSAVKKTINVASNN